MSIQNKLNILLCAAELFARQSFTASCIKCLAKCSALREHLTGEERITYGFEILRVAQVSMDNMVVSD